MMEKLMGQGKNREITHQLLSQTKQAGLGDISLSYCQSKSEQDNEKITSLNS